MQQHLHSHLLQSANTCSSSANKQYSESTIEKVYYFESNAISPNPPFW